MNVSALHGVETLIDDTNGEPIMVKENAVEVCEAEPELLTSSITSANGLLMLNENALEVCEAEPTLSPSPPAETSVRSEEPSASVVEHTSISEKSLAEEVEPVSPLEAAGEERVSEDVHTTPEEPPVATEEDLQESAADSTTVHAAVEPASEVVAEEITENHDSAEVVTSQVQDNAVIAENGHATPIDLKDERPDEVVETEPASVEVSALANGEPEEPAKEEVAVEEENVIEEVEAKEEPVAEHVITEDAVAQEEVVAQEETVPKVEVVEPLMAEAHMQSLVNTNVDSEHLVLLTSSSETCVADPQLDGEFGNGEPVSFMHNEQLAEHEIAPVTESVPEVRPE